MSEATDQLKAALPGLVHPELGPVMLVNFQTFPGQDEEQQGQIKTFTQTIAEAIEHTLDDRGFVIVPKTRLAEAPKAGSYTQVTLHCKVCGGPMLTTTMSADGLISIPPREINPDCETRHGAA
ncbi:hypothetical protein I5J42_gp78 [Mycobacterium phage GreaseLightnin]|uniref:Uncharacterized protein n=4 Tax=Caudoviricetes TaxID=2731619 RepID=A0A143FQ43_9CAUD|nr:hypothetical protein MALITHI_77 [Mycobacterium phage Malithi]YP_009303837.1 hypothetical protein SEA_SHIPWRECK_79 [Mycobacterium phage Shipwreck]YP_009964566.1 hypothetical protein I5J42_gp78 [Mycobacterium phage GreaseLightnin]YP_009964724.1 hypothetical protein I5J44_gp76 [Mycobacterium phage Phineas]ASD53700.1 hypothetical protein SEA_BOGIE_79 [Mycobacterium phage Bogie]QDH85035.1 hypothetical protein SEA_HUHILLTOP_79 [Mycobacterium phage HUHilltop]UYL87601.1 hypothetical protein SEA_DY